MNNLPIVVDLDGTLTPTDTLAESMVRCVRQSPLNFVRMFMWGMKGRAAFKSHIADHTLICGEYLPYNQQLLEYLRSEKSNGRPLILATAAHHSIAESVSRHLNLFDEVIATDEGNNLKGRAKLEAITNTVGDQFIYAGNSRDDVPVWKACRRAILVGVSSGIAESMRQEVTVLREFPATKPDIKVWLRALRVHQWIKNLLLFVPLLTTFSFSNIEKIAEMVLAFLAFSFAASSTYILNDLWDIENDRVHPRKRYRPFSSASLSVFSGVAVSAFLMVVAVLISALLLPAGFLAILLLYVVLTTLYSFLLKERVLMDVLMLSLLYTLRILAGSVAIGVMTSFWLLSFSVFVFFSLALVKRCAELMALSKKGGQATHGRDYHVDDLVVLWPLGIGSTLSAVVMFGLFISAAETQYRYATPELLWIVAVALIYWLSRIWIKTSRGDMHDDPVVYAIKDRTSRIVVFFMLVATLMSHFITLNLFQ